MADASQALLEQALRDPQVQEMVRKKGQEAMQDKEVQNAVMDYVKKNAPGAAEEAKKKAGELGQGSRGASEGQALCFASGRSLRPGC